MLIANKCLLTNSVENASTSLGLKVCWLFDAPFFRVAANESPVMRPIKKRIVTVFIMIEIDGAGPSPISAKMYL